MGTSTKSSLEINVKWVDVPKSLIDDIVKATRFDGWQNSKIGEREIQKALRKTLHQYGLHKEKELFAKAYGYIKEHY